MLVQRDEGAASGTLTPSSKNGILVISAKTVMGLEGEVNCLQRKKIAVQPRVYLV